MPRFGIHPGILEYVLRSGRFALASQWLCEMDRCDKNVVMYFINLIFSLIYKRSLANLPG